MNAITIQSLELPAPVAVLERTWRATWFVGESKLDHGIEQHNVYTADQMHQYARDYAAALSQTAGVAEGFVAIPKHYAENVGYAAAMLENSASVIDRHNAPALRNLMSLMLAAAPAASGGEGAALHPRPAAPATLEWQLGNAMWRMFEYGKSENRESAQVAVNQCLPLALSGKEIPAWRHPDPRISGQEVTAASVSERARAILSQAYRDAGLIDLPEFLVRDNTPSQLELAALRALEQALTQQRACPACASATESYCCACGWASVEATPQPGAEALRELVQRWEDEAVKCDAEAERPGCQTIKMELHRDAAQYRQCAYQLRTKLESLLARGGK